MLTPNGIRTLEFNCRFGDPETQVVLPLLETDLVEIAAACADGNLANINIQWKNNAAVCVVLASKGYPEKVESGKVVTIEKLPDDMVCFHAGTKTENGNLINNIRRTCVRSDSAWAEDIRQVRVKESLCKH